MVLHTKYIILIKIRLNTSNIIRRTIHKGIGYLRMHKDNISKLDSTPLFKVIQFQTHPPLGWKKRAQKGLFSTHPVSLRFYQPLDPKICLSSNSLWKEDPNKIKVILKLYSQASRPFSRLQLQFPKKKKKKKTSTLSSSQLWSCPEKWRFQHSPCLTPNYHPPMHLGQW